MEADSVFAMFFGLLFAGFAVLLTHSVRRFLRQLLLKKRGRRVTGKCVNFSWTRSGDVASIIEFRKEGGGVGRALSAYGWRIPVHLGECSEVVYDPEGRAEARRPGEELILSDDFFMVPTYFCAAGVCLAISLSYLL